MNFATIQFLGFFIVVFLIYRAIPLHAWHVRKLFLLVSSLFFYATWNPWLTLLLLYSIGFDFWVAQRLPAAARRPRRLLLLLSLVGNLGVLGFFKYGGFFYQNLASAAIWSPSPHIAAFFHDLVLPLGISFYTFHSVSYIVDVYRGTRSPTKNLLDYALYVSFFPQLIAGPILRAGEFLPQLVAAHRFDADEFTAGFARFGVGLAKKVVFADVLAAFADPIFVTPAAYSPLSCLLALYAYAFEIYFDFSGYTDMALGLARMLGFELVENFNAPYLAVSITDFWRRWHMSLSRWLRDYLYISLGGSRGSRLATYRNLFITMLLGGLWHGAGWNFVAWGGFHGGLLAIERALGLRETPQSRVARVLRVALTFHLVLIGWLFFRIGALPIIAEFVRTVAQQSWTAPTPAEWSLLAYLALSYGLHVADANWHLRERFQRAPGIVQGAVVGVVVILMLNLRDLHQPFVYFQF